MRKAIGYVRVSTQKQVREGLSIDAQVAKIHAWASFNEYEIEHIYIDEGISGKSTNNRPQFNQAIAALKPNMAFVFYSLSRISRNTIDTIRIGDTINKLGADMVSLSERIDTTGAAGRMLFNFLAVLNQFERDQVSERTKLAMEYLKSNQKVYSPVPFGYTRENKDLIANNDEESVIQLMLNMKNTGNGYRKIAARLNEQGIKSKSGKLWYPKTVRDVVLRNQKEAVE